MCPLQLPGRRGHSRRSIFQGITHLDIGGQQLLIIRDMKTATVIDIRVADIIVHGLKAHIQATTAPGALRMAGECAIDQQAAIAI